MKHLIGLLFLMAPLTALSTPMHIVSGEFDSGFIFLPCSFDSHADECLLDTGSPVSLIKNDAFSVPYNSIGTYKFAGADGVEVPCDIINVKNYHYADSESVNASLLRCPTSVIFGDSVIGLDEFKNKVLNFDFKSNEFSSEGQFPTNLDRSPLTLYHLGHFGFSVSFENISAESIVDTGATISTIDQDFVKSHPADFDFIQAIPGGSDSTNQPITFNLYIVKSLSIAGVNLQNIYVLATDFSNIRIFTGPNVKLVVGYNILKNQNWYFDLNRKVWSVYK